MGQYTGDCKICKKKNVSVTSNVSGECYSCYKKRKYREKVVVEAAEHNAPVAEVIVVPDPEFTEREEECIRLVDEAIAGGEWEAEEQCKVHDDLCPDCGVGQLTAGDCVYCFGSAKEDVPRRLEPLPSAEIMRSILLTLGGRIVNVPDDLALAWSDRGLRSHHVLGLMELHLSGQLAVIGSEL